MRQSSSPKNLAPNLLPPLLMESWAQLSNKMNPQIDQFQTQIDLKFNQPEHLAQALIHRSYINENRSLNLSSNERYEFLGDAVLELWSSTTLFNKFPDYNEGNLTNLRAMVVRTETLAKISQQIGLDQLVMLSRGEENHGGRTNISILADAFEALLGAIYLDQGIDNVFEFLDRVLLPTSLKLAQAKIYKDPKSIFQEIAQAKKGITPHYVTISESGPDHQKQFEVAAFVGTDQIATGKGFSKQAAEEDASIKATKILTDLV